MIRLYWAKGACSFAPHVVLEELAIPYEGIGLDDTKGENDTPAFRKVNPRGHVPAMVDGDFILTEAFAISFHLADSYPSASLLPPPGSRERARVLELGGILASVAHIHYREIRRPYRFTDEDPAYPGIRKFGKTALWQIFTEIDQRISGTTWGAGSQYSIIDPYLTIFHKWGHTAELDMTKLVYWNAHSHRVRERPAVRRVIAQEGLEPWP